MNEQEKAAIAEFKRRMARVADANEDDFNVKFSVDETGAEIEVIETADRHTFLGGTGRTIQEAIDDALQSLPAACESWGYKNAD